MLKIFTLRYIACDVDLDPLIKTISPAILSFFNNIFDIIGITIMTVLISLPHDVITCNIGIKKLTSKDIVFDVDSAYTLFLT